MCTERHKQHTTVIVTITRYPPKNSYYSCFTCALRVSRATVLILCLTRRFGMRIKWIAWFSNKKRFNLCLCSFGIACLLPHTNIYSFSSSSFRFIFFVFVYYCRCCSSYFIFAFLLIEWVDGVGFLSVAVLSLCSLAWHQCVQRNEGNIMMIKNGQTSDFVVVDDQSTSFLIKWNVLY